MNTIEKKITKTQKAFRNVVFSTIGYLLQIFLSLIVRIYFVRYIGREYLGLNSVYASILSMLSIADLGLDTVFVFLLYKPLKEKVYSKIRGVLKLYKTVYRYIALLIAVVGVAIIPFLTNIIGGKSGLSNIYLIYVLYLINSIVGYLNAYNRSLLIADQNGYIVNGITSGFIILVNVVQILQISIDQSPVTYMIIQVLGTILTNALITFIVKKKYYDVFRSQVDDLTHQEKVLLIHNGIGGVSNKIGSVIVLSSDNVLLSIFTNLVTVGMYSNYTVLTAACSKIMQLISSAITPSVGQLGVEGDSAKNKSIFLELTFIIYSLSTFVFVGFFSFVTPFVNLWVGEINVFPLFLTWLISINLWLTLVRTPSWIFADSFGLQWVQKWKSIVEAIVNLAISLAFLKFFEMGIEGIILGTILSTILIVIWYEPWTVFKYIIPELSLKKYFKFCFPFLVLVLLYSLYYYLIIKCFGNFGNISVYLDLTVAIVSLFLFLFVYILIFRKNLYFHNMILRIVKLIGNK